MAARIFEGICDFITTVVNAVIETVESTVGWVLCAVAFLVEMLFLIPIVGRFLNWVWNLVTAIVWGVSGIIDFALCFAGVKPEKKLRVSTVILKDASGNPTATTASTVAGLQTLIDTFFREANVRVVRSFPFRYDSGFAGKETADSDWVSVAGGPSSSEMLRVSCDIKAAGEDLWLPGTKFDWAMTWRNFYGNFRRLLGYGAPLTVFIVADVGGPSILGCSLGPLTDYATSDVGNGTTIAHEVGHACNLPHKNDGTNLMNPTVAGGSSLKTWQVAMIRASRHVTFF